MTKEALAECGSDSPGALTLPFLPPSFSRWGPLEQAQFLEITFFFSQYLLASQGDRVAMANSVEGRFPFLDIRLVEWCNKLSSNKKLKGLEEKWLLREVGREWLPSEICQRVKRPYRAPIHRSFFHKNPPEYVCERLSEEAILRAGIFQPAAVNQLVGKLKRGTALGETDDMALAGILSTQLVHYLFSENFPSPTPVGPGDDVKVCKQTI